MSRPTPDRDRPQPPRGRSRALAAGELPRRLHLLGAGGAGLSGLARLLVKRGHQLTGHDRAPSRFTEVLDRLGVALELGASRAYHLPEETRGVVRSAAVSLDDPQLVEARRRGLPVYKYAEVLGRLSQEHRTYAVAGTHGKTTTSWLLHHVLSGIEEGASRPGEPAEPVGALIGGVSQVLRTNAVPAARGGPLVVEACEYDRSFLQLAPFGGLITNVEADHLDYYGTEENLVRAFGAFADRIHPDGLLVLSSQVPEEVESCSAAPVWREGREFHVELLGERRGRFRLRLRGPGWATPEIEVPVPGRVVADDAALALALALGLAGRGRSGRPPERVSGKLVEDACRGLLGFRGVERRFETWARIEATGVELVHDYAHHPTEVRATLETARRAFPGSPLHVLFQPHQESRTARFLGEFVESLRGVDRAVIAPVYGARAHIDAPERRGGSVELAARLQRAGVNAVAPPTLAECVKSFASDLPRRAAGLILGAGDIDGVRAELQGLLAVPGPVPSLPR